MIGYILELWHHCSPLKRKISLQSLLVDALSSIMTREIPLSNA
jgi:hypothetical protein